tara:strand:+ start:4437 stop:5273 length:837 start_codon:yes stop_codon:yes gene_type:complete
MKYLVLMLLMIAAPAQANICNIVEENDLKINVHEAQLGSVTEKEFNTVLDKLEDLYKPVFEERGKKLVVVRKWDDGTVNAYAQQSGNVWKISMFGGLARHASITADGFALVACHEIGHHIGGFPQYPARWASNEGQADYFGNSKCMRKYMALDDSITIIESLDVPSIVEEKCKGSFSDELDLAICKRGSLAGLSLGNLFRALRNLSKPLMFSTPDSAVVSSTLDSHPAPQCRLDTYFAGAVCEKDAYDDVSNSDAAKGLCARADGYENGIRPLCWYKP